MHAFGDGGFATSTAAQCTWMGRSSCPKARPKRKPLIWVSDPRVFPGVLTTGELEGAPHSLPPARSGIRPGGLFIRWLGAAGLHQTPVAGTWTSLSAPASQGPVNHSSWGPLPAHCSHTPPCPLPPGLPGWHGCSQEGEGRVAGGSREFWPRAGTGAQGS